MLKADVITRALFCKKYLTARLPVAIINLLLDMANIFIKPEGCFFSQEIAEDKFLKNISESSEMYLETIYILEKSHGHAHIAEIARKMGVSKPSVSKSMDQLKKQDLINQDTYGPVTLTDKGKALSSQIYRKHHLISRYLEKSLALSPDEASKNACRMEHSITDAMLKAIANYLSDEPRKEAPGEQF